MKNRVFDIPLKGSRDYIQGPDLFNAVLASISDQMTTPPHEFEISFHRLARHQVELVWQSPTDSDDTFAVGMWTQNKGDKRKSFSLQETNQPLRSRLEYPEEEMVSLMDFNVENSAVDLRKSVPYSEIEVWVSMIKAMHQRRFPDATGKWVFARAKLRTDLLAGTTDHLRAEMAATLGTKLTRNAVFKNGTRIGDVFFALM